MRVSVLVIKSAQSTEKLSTDNITIDVYGI